MPKANLASAFCLLPVVTATCVVAGHPNIAFQETAFSMHHIPDIDLDGDFVQLNLPDNLKHSLDLVKQAETLPSCGKIATSALLHSCSSLEGSISHDSQLPPGSDLLIEEESDIYAARLAVCELSGADFSVPIDCRSFVPGRGGKQKSTIRGWLSNAGTTKPRTINEYYDGVTEANLKQCRKALGSSSQAWTSYSNNRQNAVAICHAMQSAVERDDSRHIAKILASTAAATTESLRDAYDHITEITQQFYELRTAMPKFQQDLATFDADIQRKARDYWAHSGQVQAGLDSLITAIDHAQHGVSDTHFHLETVLSILMPELMANITQASQQIANTSEVAAASSELIVHASQQTEQRLIERLHTVGYELDVINELMPRLSGVIESTLSTAVEFWGQATAKQHELLVAQNETMLGVELMQKKTTDVNAGMDSLSSKLEETSDKAKEIVRLIDRLSKPLDVAKIVGTISVPSLACWFFSFAFWRGWTRICRESATAIASGSTLLLAFFISILAYFYDTADLFECTMRLAPKLLPGVQLLLAVTIVIVVLVLFLLIAAVVRYVLHQKRKPSLVQDWYDPLSPPSGAEAWEIWMLEISRLTNFLPSQHPSSLTEGKF